MLFYCLLGFMVSLTSFKSLFLCNASLFSGCFQDNFLFLWFSAVCLWYIWAWISEFILFQAHWAYWIYKFVFCQTGGPFSHFLSHFLLQIFFSAPHSLISFGNTNGTSIRPFDVISQDPEALFIVLKSFFSLLFRTNNLYLCHFYLWIHWLLPLSYPLCFWTLSAFFQISRCCFFQL